MKAASPNTCTQCTPRPLAVIRGSALLTILMLAHAPTWAGTGDFQGSTHRLEYDSEPVLYSKSSPDDAIARTQALLKKGSSKGWLNFDPNFGYLPVVLDLLHVPASSQMLVFSKTSLQRNNIRPDNARALYFSDDVYVGYVPGAPVLEVAAVDPKLGAVFYTVNQDKDEPVRFRRDLECLSCHGAAQIGRAHV